MDGHGTFEVQIGEAAKVTLAVWCDCVHVFVSLMTVLYSTFTLLPLNLWSSQSMSQSLVLSVSGHLSLWSSQSLVLLGSKIFFVVPVMS